AVHRGRGVGGGRGGGGGSAGASAESHGGAEGESGENGAYMVVCHGNLQLLPFDGLLWNKTHSSGIRFRYTRAAACSALLLLREEGRAAADHPKGYVHMPRRGDV